MLIHVAQNGRMYELECQGSTSVEVIHSALASLTGIPVSDQMLICAGTRLDSSCPLSAYRLPSAEKRVFLFNRGTLLPDADAPQMEELEPVELHIPEAPSFLASGHPLDQSPNPLLRALPSYERQFKYHLQKGQAIFRATQSRYDNCRKLVLEQQVQEMALETACGNMGHYYNHICGAHRDFMEQFNRQHAAHSELLSCFERDMERLKSCHLHPSLQSQSPLRRTLLDCVKEPALRKWAHDCTISHGLFASKVGELQTLFTNLQRSVEDLLGGSPDVDVAQLVVRLDESHKYIEEQTSILQSLSKDLGTVKKLVEDCVGGRLSSSLRPLDACAALDPMSEVHIKSHLPRVESCDRKLAVLFDHVYECKATMNKCVHTELQTVAALQSRIRDLRNQLAAFREAMARQDEIFAELALVRRVLSSYQACLAEVVRRKAFATLYLGQGGQLAEKMAKIREVEVARREEFVQIHSPRYLPRDLLEGMGLLGLPSQCEVNIPDFDLSLLNIDARDLSLRPFAVPVSKLSGGNKEVGGGRTGEPGSEDGQDKGEKDGEKGGEDPGKMEMENAWLRSELAAAMTNLYAFQPEMEPSSEGGSVLSNAEKGELNLKEMASRMAEALRLKDVHVEKLQGALKSHQEKIGSYEARIKELERHLQGLQSQISAVSGGGLISVNVTDSGVSEGVRLGEEFGEEEMKRRREVVDVGNSTENAADLRAFQKSEDNLLKGTEVLGEIGIIEKASKQEVVQESLEDDTKGEVPSSVPNEVPRGAQDKQVSKTDSTTDEEPAVCEEEDVENTSLNLNPGEKTNVEVIEKATASPEGRNQEKEEEVVENEVQEKAEAAELSRQVAELQSLITQQTSTFNRAQNEAVEIRGQLKHNLDLLSECQMNCAHMENRLHEAREEARTQRAAAERRATEYSAMRHQSVRLRGLLERLQRCLSGPTGASIEALRALAASLASSSEGVGGEGEGGEWVRETVKNLVERSAYLSGLAGERAHLLEKCNAADSKIEVLRNRLNTAAEMLQVLASKHERAEQAAQLGRQKICFIRFQVHELAAFLPDSQGRYIAINKNCPNYFLSDESVALFRQRNQSSHMPCIVGQIVHIERRVSGNSSNRFDGTRNGNGNGNSNKNCNRNGDGFETLASGSMLVEGDSNSNSRTVENPYDLPSGSLFFVVTVAMVPDVPSVLTELSSEETST